MGGWGSGAYGPMGPYVRKQTIEETPFLYVQNIKDYLNNNRITCSWNEGKSSILILSKKDYILLLYYANGEKIKQRVDITFTKVGYGKRMWFSCPNCGRNTAKLYVGRKKFACRECLDLTYLTCQESGDPLDYLALKIRRLQKRLGLIGSDIYDLPYFKPKNMHWDTFTTLRTKLEIIQMHRMKAWLKVCGRFS